MKEHRVLVGDCIESMRTLPDNSIDSVVTDPPYGIRFMGKSWDGQDIEARAAYRASMPSHASACGPNGGHRSVAAEAGKYDLTPDGMRAFQAFTLEWATECLRVLKPGGHLLSFAAARTYHHMAVGIEMAGFEIRDQIMWVFGSGFPESHNLKGDRADWGTALKPAHEPICMARKPFPGTVASNVAEHGTGALNIDACRVDPTGERLGGGEESGKVSKPEVCRKSCRESADRHHPVPNHGPRRYHSIYGLRALMMKKPKNDALVLIGSDGKIRGAQFEQASRYYRATYRPPLMTDQQLALAIATSF